MNILIDIGHPAHVHLFKYLYFKLKENGHQLFVTVKDIKSGIYLLDFYKIDYINLGKKTDTIWGKGLRQIKYDFEVYKIVKEKKIDLGVSSSITLPHVSKITNMKSVVLDDDDDLVEPLFVKFGHPFSDIILTPNSIKRKSKKSLYYEGTHELAYLHPNRFTPNQEVLSEIGLDPEDKYFVMRFVAFKGHHDKNHKGFTFEQKMDIIQLLEPQGNVFITSENKIEKELERYRTPIAPEKIHSFLYYATMFIGDSQTMTSEAAVLGTPALKCNSFAGRLSVPNELEEKYQLCYSYLPENFNSLLKKCEELLSKKNLKEEWQNKRVKLLEEKIDVSAFLLWFIENYPKSVQELKNNPKLQNKFKRK